MDEKNKDLSVGTEDEESFEELFNKSFVEPVFFNPGEKIKAAVITTTKEWVFIDLGGKSEGAIAAEEFIDDEGNATVKEGDTIEAYFLSSRNNEKLFTTLISGNAAAKAHLEDVYENRIPVEGLIEKEVKGGFEVKIAGNIRAFCPFSQMGPHRIEDAEPFIGQKMIFKIIEYGENGRNIIVSHRVILEEERQIQKEALRGSLEEGMTVQGDITSVKKFGAFVDIGGIEGLIPISEISWGRVEDTESVLSIGQKVEVAIMKLDWENDKFSFSLKEIQPDPWITMSQRYSEGSTHKGKVARLAQFGAFVTLEPGIDGLMHISELGKSKRIKHPGEVLEQGQTIEVKIGKIDEEARRVSLLMISDEEGSRETDDYKKHMAGSSGKSSGSFGTLGDLLQQKLNKK
ncbi:MAG: 30S ribosomal protein S1 [Deltaproteobacteria bacterium]|nr:30S ribosomal protein S1 [Deltaproteobacteria bacterium]